MILNNYSYLYSVANTITTAIKAPNVLKNDIHTFNIKLIGSRLSAKTIQVLKWLIELGYLSKQQQFNISTAIIRQEVAGAVETYDELLGVLEDIYEIPANRKNSNSTKRTLKVGNNSIRVMGLLSNRKKKTPKLGLARKGIKKDLQINLFEEATEIENEKTISIVKQGTGGAKIIVNAFISNPWVLSMWYVKGFAKALPFNEKLLRTKGEQFKAQLDKPRKTYNIWHITNHRINTYLSEAQHQELYDLWQIDETLARVADLGLPGVAEGLIFAPLMKNILPPIRTAPVQEFRGGLDWGTSTNYGGSATALALGRITPGFKTLQIEKEYYHSNSEQYFKSDLVLVKEVVDTIIQYFKDNKDAIMRDTGTIQIYYDFAAHALGGLLEAEIQTRSGNDRAIALRISISPCVKFKVPVRVDVIKSLMSQGRIFASQKETPKLIEEWESAMYDETKKVDNRPTRLNEKDHMQDAVEYLIGADLMNFADTRFKTHNKLL